MPSSLLLPPRLDVRCTLYAALLLRPWRRHSAWKHTARLCTHMLHRIVGSPPHCPAAAVTTDLPLQDAEAFLHRSGRTGRAGKTGTAVVLFTEREARSMGLILRATKVRGRGGGRAGSGVAAARVLGPC